MRCHALAQHSSLAFALLVFSGPLAEAAPTSTERAEAPDVSVTEHALPPHSVGAPAAPPQGLSLPHFPAHEDRPPWTAVDRTLAKTYLVFSGIDAWQTGHLPSGYVEGNPLVSSWAGDRPRFEHALAFKAAASWGALALANRLKRPVHRRTVLILINVVQASVVVANERRTGGILFR